MRFVEDFLAVSRERLRLDEWGVRQPVRSLLITPRFRTSGHVIFLVFGDSPAKPVLVVKVPRLEQGNAGVQWEASCLRAVQQLRTEGFDSIPRVVSCERQGPRLVLVETALDGEPMSPRFVRRHWRHCCGLVVDWLCELGPRAACESSRDRFTRLMRGPVGRFADLCPLAPEERHLVGRSLDLVEPLDGANLPCVFEHGDLSHPNLLLTKSGRLGVLDWELAEPGGLPLQDLFFFLAYVACARDRAETTDECVRSFQRAFFGHGAWAAPYISTYAHRLQLPGGCLVPLFVACWVRYLVRLLLRSLANDCGGEPAVRNTAVWLRANRYFALWRHAVERVSELCWTVAE